MIPSYGLLRDALPHLGIVQLDSGERLIVKDGSEVLIPKAARKNLINVLHLTHLAVHSMLLQCKSRIFWPGMKKDLEACYRECQECALHKKIKATEKE